MWICFGSEGHSVPSPDCHRNKTVFHVNLLWRGYVYFIISAVPKYHLFCQFRPAGPILNLWHFICIWHVWTTVVAHKKRPLSNFKNCQIIRPGNHTLFYNTFWSNFKLQSNKRQTTLIYHTVSHPDLLKMQILPSRILPCVISACMSESVFVPSKRAIINYIMYFISFYSDFKGRKYSQRW